MTEIDEIFGGIAEASQAGREEPGDYYENGFLHCGKCHTPKEREVSILGRIRKVGMLCSCGAAADQARREAAEEEQRLIRINRLRSAGFPDAEMAKWTFDRDDGKNPKLSHLAHGYVDNFRMLSEKGKGLLLYGSVGTGKTFAAACIANALTDQGKPCLVTNFARLVNTLDGMREGRQEYIDRLGGFALLVIDDLAAERSSDYMGEIVQNIIDSRYRSGKPLIVTTNLTASELKHPTDMRRQRIFSRLFEMCIPFEVVGDDRRKSSLMSDYDEYKDILGL